MSLEFDLAYEEAVFGAEKFFGNLSDNEINKFLLSLFAVRRFANKDIDKFNLKLYFTAAKRIDRFSEEKFRTLAICQSKFKSPSMEIAKKNVSRLQDVGGSSVKTGHYRRLTLPHIHELIQAGRANTYMVLLIESNERTERFKQKKSELTNEQRILMFEQSGLVNGGVYLIEGDDYGDKFYRDLIKEWSPAFYLGNESWPNNVKSEARLRSRKSGATFIELGSYLPSISTTSMEKFILKQ